MKIKTKLLVALSACMAFSVTAEEKVTGPYVGVGYSQFVFDDDRMADDTWDPYLNFGYQLTNNWGIQIDYADADSEFEITEADFDYKHWALDFVYRYQKRGSNSAYWKLGFARNDTTGYSSDESAIKLGAGYDFAINQNFSWQIGLDWIREFDNRNDADLMPYVGIQYFWGSSSTTAPKPAPKKMDEPKDSDNDGVIDLKDKCPNTPSGMVVAANGCEKDSDKDGVKDSMDLCPKTPYGAKVDTAGCRQKLAEKVTMKLNINFENDSNEISSSFHDELKRVADFMRQYPDTKTEIQGHTDWKGPQSYNQPLSQRRADAVKQYLIENFKIDASRLSAKGYGELLPIADNKTEAGRAQNRRVVATFETVVKK